MGLASGGVFGTASYGFLVWCPSLRYMAESKVSSAFLVLFPSNSQFIAPRLTLFRLAVLPPDSRPRSCIPNQTPSLPLVQSQHEQQLITCVGDRGGEGPQGMPGRGRRGPAPPRARVGTRTGRVALPAMTQLDSQYVPMGRDYEGI